MIEMISAHAGYVQLLPRGAFLLAAGEQVEAAPIVSDEGA
jgi:hypothetical protein